MPEGHIILRKQYIIFKRGITMLGVMPDEEKMMEEIARSLETRDGEFGRMYEDTLPEASR